MGGLGVPQAKKIYRLATITDNAYIIRYAFDDPAIDPIRFKNTLTIHFVFHPTVELHFLREVRPHDLPRAASIHPHIWVLNLMTVFELLTKQAELVVDAITYCGQIQCGQRIEEASS